MDSIIIVVMRELGVSEEQLDMHARALEDSAGGVDGDESAFDVGGEG